MGTIQLRDVKRDLENERQNLSYQKKLFERSADVWEEEITKVRREVKIYQEREIEEKQDKMSMQKEYYDMKDSLKVQEAGLILLIKKNEELMNKYNELRDELREELRDTEEEEEEVRNIPVAKQEEPEPHKEEEGMKEESNLLESTTGAVLGDSEADNETSTAQERPDQKNHFLKQFQY